MTTRHPTYKRNISKPPRLGWHCVVDGYDFKRESRAALIETITEYMKQADIDGDPERIVELQFCEDNPDQCNWEGSCQ
jgi:hypothetical protein